MHSSKNCVIQIALDLVDLGSVVVVELTSLAESFEYFLLLVEHTDQPYL